MPRRPPVPNEGFPWFVRARDPWSRLLARLGFPRYRITELGRHELLKRAGELLAQEGEPPDD